MDEDDNKDTKDDLFKPGGTSLMSSKIQRPNTEKKIANIDVSFVRFKTHNGRFLNKMCEQFYLKTKSVHSVRRVALKRERFNMKEI